MENNFETREFEIDFKKLYNKMKPRMVLVVIITILTAILAGAITHFFITPQYSSTVKMYVYSNSDRVTTNSSITTGEITASQDLINTYIYILKSDTVLEAVAKDLGLDISPNQLKGLISAKKAQDTVAFEITVTCSSAKWSSQIANSIAKIAPAEIVRVVKAGGVEIIDYAKTPKTPSSPNFNKNVLIGALVGFLVSFSGFLLYELFDTSVTSVKDLEREFDFPVLGTIPRLDAISKNDNEGYGQATPARVTNEFDIAPPVATQPSDTIINNLKAMKGDEQ